MILDWLQLKKFYEATDGDNWTNNSGWDVTNIYSNLCDAEGITCDSADEFVTQMYSINSVHILLSQKRCFWLDRIIFDTNVLFCLQLNVSILSLSFLFFFCSITQSSIKQTPLP